MILGDAVRKRCAVRPLAGAVAEPLPRRVAAVVPGALADRARAAWTGADRTGADRTRADRTRADRTPAA
ncbi:hypothetical protein KCV87_10765 [Actinosynnema pretiosum subsp. pretiosum]|uniref:Uncharacterized protein n=1 Tax=Actinosynnema pretiosum subsp. pretiosum TaxID=103721 RepID=A0AA45LBD9_9PSEU|nr:hypothetical protein APASM_1885 [Actinosynnema pretiosum subsp. pretiosum]QUF06488.1 hypothetical protein KCV87_10765 [Actinosynnema pretiosum subsp. pretiosum]